MRSYIFLSVLFITSLKVSGQNGWIEQTHEDGIRFLVRDQVCDWEGLAQPVTFKFIKLENETVRKARVSYRLEIYYDDHCAGCNGSSEYMGVVQLEPRTSVEGGCKGTYPARLDILVDNPNLVTRSKYSHFKINDIHVEWIE